MAKSDAPRWSKDMRTLIVNLLATWIPYKEVWQRVTSDELRDTHNLEPLDPEIYGYDMFRMRCKRIPKQTIALAHEAWKKTYDNIRYAEETARVQAMSDLIDKINQKVDDNDFDKDTTGTMAALVGQLRGLYEQLRKEISADEDRAALSASGTRVLLTNPENVEIDAGHVGELMMVYREEIGGLHNLDFAALNLSELDLLLKAIQCVIDTKLGAIEEAVIDNTDELCDDVSSPIPSPEPEAQPKPENEKKEDQ